MKKKLAALLCGILCVCLLSVPVYAETGGSRPQDEPAITITEDGTGESGAIVVGVTGQEPVSTATETIEGVPYITKVYELPQGVDASSLTASFEQDGFLFTEHDVSQQVRQGQTDSKTVTQTETVESESGKVADIIAQAERVLPYSEDGYTGQLSLEVAAIVVEENGTSTYSYRVEDVREYTNLDRNDAAYVPKTVLKNGATLQLENIEWVVMGQHPVDGRMVPNLFKAIATYAGTAIGSRATGYTAILTYTGEVVKATPGIAVYTVVFRGEPLAASGAASGAEDVSKPVGDADNAKSGIGMVLMTVVVILLSAACLAVAGVRIYQRIRDRRGGDDEDYTGEDFSDYEGYAAAETGPAHNGQEDDRWLSDAQDAPLQGHLQDEFNIDDLFNKEGFFSD